MPLLFSLLGGALLTRYLLPMYPLVLLLAVTTFYRRVPFWRHSRLFSAAAFVLGLFINPPYGFAPEDNLAYAHVIRLHQAGIDQLSKRYPGATVLSAWPMTDELTRPELGYLKQPYDVYRLEDFTAAQIARAAAEPEKYSAALVFSTKYDPPSPLLHARAWKRSPRRALLRPSPRPAARGHRPRTPRRRWCGSRRITASGSPSSTSTASSMRAVPPLAHRPAKPQRL